MSKKFITIFLFTLISTNIFADNEDKPWNRHVGKILLCQHSGRNNDSIYYGSRVSYYEFISHDKSIRRGVKNRDEMISNELLTSATVDYLLIGNHYRINMENLDIMMKYSDGYLLFCQCEIYNDDIKNLVQEMNSINEKNLLKEQTDYIELYKKNKI